MTSFVISNTIFMSYWAIRHKETCLILATLRIERPNNFQTPKTLFEHLDRWSCMSWNPATGLICTCSHSVLGSSWKTLSCLKFCRGLHPLRRDFPDNCSKFWDGAGESDRIRVVISTFLIKFNFDRLIRVGCLIF